MEPVHHLLWRNSLPLRADRDGGAMLIRAGHHQHFAPFGAFVPVLNVRWEIAAGHVTKMERPVGIGPRHTDQHVLGGIHRSAAHGHIT